MTWSRAMLHALAWAFVCLASTEPSPATETDAAPLSADEQQADRLAHEQSRRIFEFGVHLFQQGNLIGALTQFEAAYQVHPNSAALQNIALCQKGLYRYREAKRTLEHLLERHANELSAQDRKTALNVITELDAFIGKVQIIVHPESARVTIDQREYDGSELTTPLELDVGEHRLEVQAPGYASKQETLSVAGGVGNAPVNVSLSPTHGYLTVLTPDDRTAIAIDGRAVAFEEYRGFVEPGRHVIQVYRSGFEPYEAVVELDAGQSVTVRGKVGAPLSESERAELEEPQRTNAPAPRQLRGWYGLIDGSLLNWSGAPEDVDSVKRSSWGTSYGLHAGYRFFTPIGIEAVVGIAHHEANGACSDVTSSANCYNHLKTSSPFDYSLDSRRVGGALRIMSGGEGVRFTSSVGVGAVSHDLHFSPDSSPALTLKGFDAYFALEAGAQINIDHFLVEMVGFGWFDSASSIHFGDWKPYEQGNGIQMFGLSLRVGWSEWTPRDARSVVVKQ